MSPLKTIQERRPLAGSALACSVHSLGGSDGAIATASGYSGPIRVAGGVPGDRGVVRVLHSGQHGAWARWLRLDEPSSYRRAAECAAVLRCGGCPWQMVDAEMQRQTRLDAINLHLHRWLGPVEPSWAPLQEMSVGYRSRAQVVLGRKRGRIVWGFWGPGSQELAAVELCPAHLRSVDQALNRAADELDRAGVPVAGEADGIGATGLIYRIDPRSELGMLTVLCGDVETLRPAVQGLSEIPGVVGVFAAPVARKGGPPVGERAIHLAGALRAPLAWQLAAADLPDLELQLGPTAFVQTRHDAAEGLIAAVAAMLPSEGPGLLDLFSGAGVFGLALRQRFAEVWLVEREGPSIADAQVNVDLLEAGNVRVCPGDAAEVLAQLHRDGATFGCAVVDPPRAGCGPEVVKQLSAIPSLRQIAYVSCGQSGLQRDVAAFAEHGWRITAVQALEMFPHTPHAEVLVQLSR